MRNDKVRDENGQTRLLMGCIYNPDLMDEPLLKYMLENKEEMIDDFCCVSEDRYGVTKNNLWSKIKSEANKGGQSLAKVTITKWAKILNKDVNEKALYKYSKTKFYNKKKNDEEAYVPFFFSENQGDFLDVSEDFFAITRHQIFNVIKPESLSNTEMKLIINDLLNDDNVNDYVLMRCENYTELVETIKNFIINNCEEMLGIAKRQKKSLLKLIANGSIVLNDAIQSIQGEELDVFLSINCCFLM